MKNDSCLKISYTCLLYEFRPFDSFPPIMALFSDANASGLSRVI